jgi:hypothetical protein
MGQERTHDRSGGPRKGILILQGNVNAKRASIGIPAYRQAGTADEKFGIRPHK